MPLTRLSSMYQTQFNLCPFSSPQISLSSAIPQSERRAKAPPNTPHCLFVQHALSQLQGRIVGPQHWEGSLHVL